MSERPKVPELLKKGLSHLHEALADYMLINPGATLREMGAYFGYSIPWLSRVITSDMFRAYLSERRKDINAAVAEDLPSKLVAAAHIATERMMEIVTTTTDPELVIDSFDKILHRCGFAPSAKTPVAQPQNVQNNFFLSPTDLASAREQLIRQHQPSELTVQGESTEVSVPAA